MERKDNPVFQNIAQLIEWFDKFAAGIQKQNRRIGKPNKFGKAGTNE
jgi:hypothetical protein